MAAESLSEEEGIGPGDLAEGVRHLPRNLMERNRPVIMSEVQARASVVVACAVIMNRDKRLLAALRPEGKSLGGKWEFPGGKVEAGESPREALKRELREELSIDASVGRALTVVHHDYAQFSIELHPFLAEIQEGVPHPHEHAEIRWVTMDEAADLDWAEADVPVLAELRQD